MKKSLKRLRTLSISHDRSLESVTIEEAIEFVGEDQDEQGRRQILTSLCTNVL